MKNKTVTITLDEHEVAILEQMQAKYGKLASFTSCACASLGIGLDYYVKALKLDDKRPKTP